MTADAIDHDFAPENPVTERRYSIVGWFGQDPAIRSIATIGQCQCAHPTDLFIDNCREQNIAGERNIQFP